MIEDDWVVCASCPYGAYMYHEIGQVDRITKKLVYVKIGAGRRPRQFSKDNVIKCKDEAAARLLVQRLESAKAECQQRERAARNAYKEAIGKLYLAEQQS